MSEFATEAPWRRAWPSDEQPGSSDEKPPWWKAIEDAYSVSMPDEPNADEPSVDEPNGFWEERCSGFPDAVWLDIARPLLRRARLEWARQRPGADAFLDLWCGALPRDFLRDMSRMLVLELYICRYQEILQGESPEERFASFLSRQSRPEAALEMFATYPVLARALTRRIEQWTHVGLELHQRLEADRSGLTKTFGVSGELSEIAAGLGDRHEDGRTPAALTFSCGAKIVYKPRPANLDLRLRELLDRLGFDQADEQTPDLRLPRLLARDEYAWFEYIAPRPCRGAAELDRFYRRQGAWLAIFYALEATDIHHQNVIAAGEHPVPIDLETLCQPLHRDDDEIPGPLDPTAESVLRCGLLPLRLPGKGDKAGVDLSGLGASRGQRVVAHELHHVGTDEMVYADRVRELEVGDHRPTLHGEEVVLEDFLDPLIEGFRGAYARLLSRRTVLEEGLDRFANCEIRVIMRPTALYGRLLYAAFHPDALQDVAVQEQLFGKLRLGADPRLEKLVPIERRDLLRGDIPRLRARIDGRNVLAEDFRVREILPESGLQRVRRRARHLSTEDLERQVDVIQLAFAADRRPSRTDDDENGRDVSPGSGPGTQTPPKATQQASPQVLVAAAERIGERLERMSFSVDERLGWFHLAPENKRLALRRAGADLYDGHAGIALFFAQLGLRTGNARWTRLARRSLAEVLRTAPSPDPLGFGGLGGRIYALAYLARLWDDPVLLDAAVQSCAAATPEVIEADEHLDLLSGTAGCLAGLLALHGLREDEASLRTAVCCGDYLLARASDAPGGRAWDLPRIAEEPPTGFAHGASGILWSLARLAERTGEERFEIAARQAWRYEQSRFSPQRDNWANRHPGEKEPSFSNAWCYGAPGIGLARLDLRRLFGESRFDPATLDDEIRAAVRATRAHGFGPSHGSQSHGSRRSHCLCHGDFGNLDLLLDAAKHFGDEELQASLERTLGEAVGDLRRGVRCGLGETPETPGLMVGLAGVGYGLLRAAFPHETPSVLRMQMPPISSP